MGTDEMTAKKVDASVSLGMCLTPMSNATASLMGDNTKFAQVTRSRAKNPIQVEAGALGRMMRARHWRSLVEWYMGANECADAGGDCGRAGEPWKETFPNPSLLRSSGCASFCNWRCTMGLSSLVELSLSGSASGSMQKELLEELDSFFRTDA